MLTNMSDMSTLSMLFYLQKKTNRLSLQEPYLSGGIHPCVVQYDWFVYILYITLPVSHIFKQECIPVGCVPPDLPP